MESNKPFKTISLEERLAQSVMGQFDPRTSNKTTDKITQIPKTSFSNTIRLENRLTQPLDSSTTHLAKYFLSDTYTGFLAIPKFETPPLTSQVTVDPYGFIDKGSVTFHRNQDTDKGSKSVIIKSPRSTQTTTLLQGSILSNGVAQSIVDVRAPKNNTINLINQGAVLSNNVFRSVIEIKQSAISELLNQGSIETERPVGVLDNAVLQGLVAKEGGVVSSVIATTDLKPIPTIIGSVPRFPNNPSKFELPLLSAKESSSPAVNVSGQPLQPTTQYQRLAPILQNLDSSLDVLKKEIVGYGSATIPFSYSPTPYYSPTLQLLRYETDRLLARFAPQIKHGSTNVSAFNTQVVQGETNVDASSLIPTTQYGPNKPFFNTGNSISPLPASAQSDPYWTSNTSGDRPDVVQSGADVGFGNVNRELWETIRQALTEGSTLPVDNITNFPSGQTSLGSLSRYRALSYGEIDAASSAAASNAGKSAQAASGPNPQIGAGNRVVQNVPDYNGKDFIKIKIDSETLGRSVVFKAYLDSFSDSFSTNWNDVKYVGRQDTFKQFQGATRAVSFGISVPSFSKVDLPINMKKIQDAIRITSVATFQGKYLKGPLCKLTLGGFFKNVYCVFNNVKIDMDTTEATWDIDSGLPHLLKMTFDVAMLGDANGKGLDAATNTYYNNY